jgi:hypothetical protein
MFGLKLMIGVLALRLDRWGRDTGFPTRRGILILFENVRDFRTRGRVKTLE